MGHHQIYHPIEYSLFRHLAYLLFIVYRLTWLYRSIGTVQSSLFTHLDKTSRSTTSHCVTDKLYIDNTTTTKWAVLTQSIWSMQYMTLYQWSVIVAFHFKATWRSDGVQWQIDFLISQFLLYSLSFFMRYCYEHTWSCLIYYIVLFSVITCIASWIFMHACSCKLKSEMFHNVSNVKVLVYCIYLYTSFNLNHMTMLWAGTVPGISWLQTLNLMLAISENVTLVCLSYKQLNCSCFACLHWV